MPGGCGGCIEATPAVWDGRIYIGTRSGYLFVLGEAPATSATTTTGPTRSTPSTATTRPTSYGE